MAALLSRDGIRCLSWMTWSMPTDRLKILLEGVASDSCLESFELDISQIESNQVVGRYLVQALQRNKSLKNISLCGVTRNEPTIFQDILKASILGPNVKAVFIHDSSAPTLRVDVLQDVLCRKDCTLEKLHLHGINVLTGDRWNGSIIQNLSVTNLRVSGSTHDSASISKIISLFKSLEELDISNNHITELSFLDPLLFGKRSTLKLLDVSRNIIEEEEMKCFIEKLRNIRGLKSLGFWYEGLRDSDSIKTALYCALRNNTDLECVDFPRRDLPLDLNRGGRRAFESSQSFPRSLIPRVLERASNTSYYAHDSSYGCEDEWGSPTNKEARVDVVFWMVHRIVPQL